MPDDILPPADLRPGSIPPGPSDPAPRREVTCGFCESRLTHRGEVLKLSDRAKALRDFEDDLEDARRDLVQAQARVTALETEMAEIRAQSAKKDWWRAS